jgi:TPR repeat protein
MRLVGTAYSSGRGVPEDQTEAVKWFRKSAELGDGAAQMIMGTRCATGKGCTKNLEEAYMWYDLAGMSGFASGKEACESLSREMTQQQIAEGQLRSKEWQAAKASKAAPE